MPVASSSLRSVPGSRHSNSSDGRGADGEAMSKTAPEPVSAHRGHLTASSSSSDSSGGSTKPGSIQTRGDGCRQPSVPTGEVDHCTSEDTEPANAAPPDSVCSTPIDEEDAPGHSAHPLRHPPERRSSVQALIAMFNPGRASREPRGNIDGLEVKLGPSSGLGNQQKAGLAMTPARLVTGGMSASARGSPASAHVVRAKAPAQQQQQPVAAAANSNPIAQQRWQAPRSQQQQQTPLPMGPKPAVKPRPVTSAAHPVQQAPAQQRPQTSSPSTVSALAAKTAGTGVGVAKKDTASPQPSGQQLSRLGAGATPQPHTAASSGTGAGPLPRTLLLNTTLGVTAQAGKTNGCSPVATGARAENSRQPVHVSLPPAAAAAGGAATVADLVGRAALPAAAAVTAKPRPQKADGGPVDNGGAACRGEFQEVATRKQQHWSRVDASVTDIANSRAPVSSAGMTVDFVSAVKLRPTGRRLSGSDAGDPSAKMASPADLAGDNSPELASAKPAQASQKPAAAVPSERPDSVCSSSTAITTTASDDAVDVGAAADAGAAEANTQAAAETARAQTARCSRQLSSKKARNRYSAGRRNSAQIGRLVARGPRKQQQQQRCYEIGQAADVSDIVAGTEPTLAAAQPPRSPQQLPQQTLHAVGSASTSASRSPRAHLPQPPPPPVHSLPDAVAKKPELAVAPSPGSRGDGCELLQLPCCPAAKMGCLSSAQPDEQRRSPSPVLLPSARGEKATVAATDSASSGNCDGSARQSRVTWMDLDLDGGGRTQEQPASDGCRAAGGTPPLARPQQQHEQQEGDEDEWTGQRLTESQWSLVDSVLAATGLAQASAAPQQVNAAAATAGVVRLVIGSDGSADEEWESDTDLSESSHSHTGGGGGSVEVGSSSAYVASTSASHVSLPSEQEHTSYTLRRCPPKPPKASLASRARLTAARIRHRLKLRRLQQRHRTASRSSAACSPTDVPSAGARLQAFFSAGGLRRFFRRLASTTVPGIARAASTRSAADSSATLVPAPTPVAPSPVPKDRAAMATAAPAASVFKMQALESQSMSVASHAQRSPSLVDAVKAATGITACASWSDTSSSNVVARGNAAAEQPSPPAVPLRKSVASSSVPELSPCDRPPQLPERTTSLNARRLQPLTVRASFPGLSDAALPDVGRPLACSMSVELDHRMASAAIPESPAAATPSVSGQQSPLSSATVTASSAPLRKVKLTTTRRHLRSATTTVTGLDSLLSLPPSSASFTAATEGPARPLSDVTDALHDHTSSSRLASMLASELQAASETNKAATAGAARSWAPVPSPRLSKREPVAGGSVAGVPTAADDGRRPVDGTMASYSLLPAPKPLPCDREATGDSASSASSSPKLSVAGDARRQCSTSSQGSSASTNSTTSGYHSAMELASLVASVVPDRPVAGASLPLTDADLVVSAAFGVTSATGEYDDCIEPLYQSLPDLVSAHTGGAPEAGAAAINGAADAAAQGSLGQQQPPPSAAAGGAQSVIVLRESMALPQRWCDTPQVKACGVLGEMSATETKLQEAMFELLTSEASYLQGLDVLVNVFVKSASLNDDNVLPPQARQTLFCNVDDIHQVSQRLYKDLDQHWQENIVMFDVCDILVRYASDKLLDVYIKYCSNQVQQREVVETLRANNPRFVEAVRELERHPSCRNLGMSSYLLLPMQRITRYPLLVDAIMRRLEVNTQHEFAARRCYCILKEIVRKCNEVARLMDQAKQLVQLEKQLRFTKVKKVPIVSASRSLIKKADLTLFVDEGNKARTGTLTSRILAAAATRNEIRTLFLFNDLVLIAKKKGSEVYSVVDYASRAAVTVDVPHAGGGWVLPPLSDGAALPTRQLSSAASPALGGSGSASVAAAVQHAMLLVLLQNHQKKHAEYVLGCQSESERERWMEALAPSSLCADDERIYESWDCPQVRATADYVTDQAGELSLRVGDVVNVNRKMNDGWYEGERISDGCHGWFPSSYTEELPSEHRRVKHLKQRYDVLKAAAVKVKAALAGDLSPMATVSSAAGAGK